MATLIAAGTTQVDADLANDSGTPKTISVFPAAGTTLDALSLVELYLKSGTDLSYIDSIGGLDPARRSLVFTGGGTYVLRRLAHPSGKSFGVDVT